MANCNITWDSFEGDIPDSLMYFFIFYCYAVCLVGTLLNGVVLWCVVGCPRTSSSIKVLMCAVFSSTLLMCLLVMPYMAHTGISKVQCDRPIPRLVFRVMRTLYIILAMMELLYITVMAFLRAMAVWSSTRWQVKLRTAVILLIGIVIYCTGMTLLILARFWRVILGDNTSLVLTVFYNCVNFVIPVLFTIGCYLCMMLAVRRNKHRLAATPNTAVTGQVMDQATRAMLAVFISNLLLGLPHSTYHVLPFDLRDGFNYVIMHIVYYAHLYVDPLAFLCFNLHHRERLLHTLKSCLRWVSCTPFPAPPQANSTLPLPVTSSTSSV